MKNCGHCNVRKHRDIKNGEKYITLNIYLDFGSLNNMKITSSDPRDYFGGSGKGLITFPSLKTIRRSNKIKKARFDITNVSLKDLSKIIEEFEDLPHEDYARKRSKHVTTGSYFYSSR